MPAPLEGIRVLEVANWLAAPAAALMADLGAEVLKVEPPGGDVCRGFLLSSMGYRHAFAGNYAFELDNRGKRSITVSLDEPGGPELVKRLARDADVFLTNLVQPRREKYGLTCEDVRAVNPRLIYASFSGYGARGPDRGRPGFDYAAFWANGLVRDDRQPRARPLRDAGHAVQALRRRLSACAAPRRPRASTPSRSSRASASPTARSRSSPRTA